MFTGIIESQAVLCEKKKFQHQFRLTFEVLGGSSRFRNGESVAVDGVCLTVSAFRRRKFSSEVIPETLRATTLGKLRRGERVNLERSLRVGDPLGGHWVSGHVDGIGFISTLERRKENFRLQIEAPADIIRRLVCKGSIAIDGISFTLQEVRTRSFIVGVIPHTYRMTTLPWKRVGDPVNLEVDLFARLTQHFLSGMKPFSFKEKDLRRQGF